MAIELPATPKVYTTVYDNFKGVDFTNDASNVWSHRSPNAVNIMPDLAGRPWKRTGWKIEKTTQDFKDCYNTTMGYSEGDPDYYEGSVIPIKTNYFSLGGEDFLAITNNLGLFIYSKFIGGAAKEEPYLMYISGYFNDGDDETDPTKFHQAAIEPNANRAFFFEGKGIAGFYAFCTKKEGTPVVSTTELFRFDGEVLRKTTPYVPVIMVSKPAGDSAGTLLYSPNILTLQRIVQFIGDGSGVNFNLPEKADTGKTIKVEVLSSGQWVTKTVTTDYNVSHVYVGGIQVTRVAFTSPPASGNGEDNIRVTYSIIGNAASPITNTKQGNIKIWTKKRQTRSLVYKDYGSGWGEPTISGWSTAATTTGKVAYSSVIPNLVMSNNKPDIAVYLKTDSSTWSGSAVSGGSVVSSYSSYTDTLTVNVNSPSGYKTTKTETSSIESISSNITTPSSSGGEVSVKSVKPKRIKTVKQQRYVTTTDIYPVKIVATVMSYAGTPTRTAFESCIRAHVFGDGIINSVFMTGATIEEYGSRVWWSATADPTYFPDTNYFEAGSNDTRIAGLIDVGEYLGVIKQGESTNSTIYLAYQTKVASGEIVTTTSTGSTSETTYDVTYAVKTSIGGVGAISNGAFNILNGEPLFLSRYGIMGINPQNENEKQLRNRSFFVNKKMLAEPDIENAFSFIWRNMYILAVNNHCYILDGSQKSSWANEKTNLQYEAYYWENVPAQCFARYNGQLWFTDPDGRLCRFKDELGVDSYHDDYDSTVPSSDPTTMYGHIPLSAICDDETLKVDVTDTFFTAMGYNTGQYVFTFGSAGYLHRTNFGQHNAGNLDTTQTVGTRTRSSDSIQMYYHDSEGWHYDGEPVNLANYGITILEGNPILNCAITITVGAPIYAKWTTVLDDDNAANYFKTLQKKGTMVVLYPQSSTGVKVYLKKDNAEPLYIGTATVRGSNNEITAPSDYYLRKKAKKYKRLQIIAENDGFDETFGIDEIIKCYTLGNYSRNR